MLVRDIVAATSVATGISNAALYSHDRSRAVARPRQVAMFLATRLTRQSLPAIGRAIGERDHATVVHANERIEAILAAAEDAHVADTVATVLDLLGVEALPPPRPKRTQLRAISLRSRIARAEADLTRLRDNLAALSGAVQ